MGGAVQYLDSKGGKVLMTKSLCPLKFNFVDSVFILLGKELKITLY